MTTIGESIPRADGWASKSKRQRKSERVKCSLACLLLQCVSSMAERKTSKLQSTVTKTVALSSQPASKDFLNYQQCSGRAALLLICHSSKETETALFPWRLDHNRTWSQNQVFSSSQHSPLLTAPLQQYCAEYIYSIQKVNFELL